MSPSIRLDLAALLTERRAEIEAAVLTRVHGISDPTEVVDPSYVEGLRATIAVGFDYALLSLEQGGERVPPPPPAALSQARLAARNDIDLGTVFRRYFAGYALLCDFLIGASRTGEGEDAESKGLLRTLAAAFDGLLAAVAEEHAREARRQPGLSPERRLAERARRLLDGELLDAADLAYDLSGWHLALLAAGAGAPRAVRSIAEAVDCRLLLVRPDEQTVWAWLGGRRRIDGEEVRRLAAELAGEARVALGEPGRGEAGWRHSHRQARAVFSLARREGGEIVRYEDVGLLASVLRDEVLVSSLRRSYLEPLGAERDGGVMYRTLRAYIEAGHNASSAAVALGVSRQTVNKRLRVAEARIGRPLDSCVAELEVALALHELE